MDTDENDINHGINNIPAENAAMTDKQDFKPAEAQTEPCVRNFPPTKEPVEILSVEFVQPALVVRQHNDQLEMANVPSGMEVENECNNYSMETENKAKQEVFETLQKNECGPPDPKDSVEILTNIDIENKISVNIAQNQDSADCRTLCTEKTEIHSTIKETLTDTIGEQISAEVTESDKYSKMSVPETNNEMEVIEEIFTNVSTLTENLAPTEALENIEFDITNRHNFPLTPIEILQNPNSSTPNRDGEEALDATTNSTNGLSLLAQYGSDVESNDSDSNSVIEVSTSTHQDYRSKVVEIDSESDSDSSGSDVEYLNVLRKTIEKRMEIEDDDDEDEDVEEIKSDKVIRKKPAPKIKAKGELQLDDLPPIEDLHITVPEDECIVLGKIHSIVDQLVLVSVLPNSVLVDLESVLFLAKGQKVLGAVFDVLGQVNDPLYCVRFNSNKQINEKDIKVNDVVYLAPKTPYTQYIILSSITRQKGSDASWEHDLEPPPRFLDYSDDEEQQRARKQSKSVERPVDNDDPQKNQKRDSEGSQVSSVSNKDNYQPRQRHPAPTRGRGGAHNRGAYFHTRQQHNPQYRNPQVPINHNPSSWHSNYYPQAYATMPPQNVPYGGGYPRMPAQVYTQVPMYQMAMPYHSSSAPLQHPMPPNNHHVVEHQQQFEVNGFSIRPPTIPGHYDMPPPQPRSQ